jgi:hypothetical protein
MSVALRKALPIASNVGQKPITHRFHLESPVAGQRGADHGVVAVGDP